MSIINFYKHVSKKDIPPTHNPNIEQHHIKIPMRMLVIGASGSGKTNFCINLIKIMNNTFHNLIIVTKNKEEPLYIMLKKKLKNDVSIVEGISAIPNLDDFDKNEQTLIVFDDLINEKKKDIISEYYLRCRKLNVSVCFLSQSYFKIPQLIRQNSNYIVIIKVSSMRDLMRMLSEYNFGISKETLIQLYKQATTTKFGFLMIAVDEDVREKFYINWKHVDVQTDI